MLSPFPLYSTQPDLKTCPFCEGSFFFFSKKEEKSHEILFIAQKPFVSKLLKEVREVSAARFLADFIFNPH